jgi:hypothetical protein
LSEITIAAMKTTFLMISMNLVMYTQGMTQNLMTESIKFASIEKAKQLLSEEDSFTQAWSQFDIDSRMGRSNSSRAELFNLINTQVREWSTAEEELITGICKDIDSKMATYNFQIDFPEEIYFLKTTGDEEGGATGYTRNTYIVLKEGATESSRESLEHLIVHELFHVLTRNNPEFRKEMYKIIGFNITKSIAYPDNIKSRRITNPDAPQTDSYINLTAEGKELTCMMILYAKEDYSGGSFFDYLNIGFLSLVGDEEKTPELIDGESVIYSIDQIGNFFEQVGRNTNYIIHPEEILAENFSYAILGKEDLKDSAIVDAIRKKLIKR